jgi:glycosyltransferase involved in cell wall biosynthesis
MKIAIISHSPVWTTGFGTTCFQIAFSLSSMGHNVFCLSLGERDEARELKMYPFRILPIKWENSLKEFATFFIDECPDAILFNFDINAIAYLSNICTAAGYSKKKFAHVVIDGFPVKGNLINALHEMNGIIVPTKSSLNYLRSKKIKNAHYAPHGVNTSQFICLSNKKRIRNKLPVGLVWGKYFLVGVFAKNEERKQIPKILMALHHLVYTLKIKDIIVYLHTQAIPEKNKGWDLEFVVEELKLNNYVVFTEPGFRQDIGPEKNFDEDKNEEEINLSYLERINMCDLIVNIPFSGGFELCNIEAQSCGVPVLTIDDHGNIKEVVGESAILIQPKMKTIWGNGAWIYLVDEKELAEKILYLKNNPDILELFRQKGVENSKKYKWDFLEKKLKKLFSSLDK